jgi:hypothetical protein
VRAVVVIMLVVLLDTHIASHSLAPPLPSSIITHPFPPLHILHPHFVHLSLHESLWLLPPAFLNLSIPFSFGFEYQLLDLDIQASHGWTDSRVHENKIPLLGSSVYPVNIEFDSMPQEADANLNSLIRQSQYQLRSHQRQFVDVSLQESRRLSPPAFLNLSVALSFGFEYQFEDLDIQEDHSFAEKNLNLPRLSSSDFSPFYIDFQFQAQDSDLVDLNSLIRQSQSQSQPQFVNVFLQESRRLLPPVFLNLSVALSSQLNSLIQGVHQFDDWKDSQFLFFGESRHWLLSPAMLPVNFLDKSTTLDVPGTNQHYGWKNESWRLLLSYSMLNDTVSVLDAHLWDFEHFLPDNFGILQRANEKLPKLLIEGFKDEPSHPFLLDLLLNQSNCTSLSSLQRNEASEYVVSADQSDRSLVQSGAISSAEEPRIEPVKQVVRIVIRFFQVLFSLGLILEIRYCITIIQRLMKESRSNMLSSLPKAIALRTENLLIGHKQHHCNICMDDEEQDCISLKSCGHVYHFDCVLEWLKHDKNICPTCRSTIIPGLEISAVERVDNSEVWGFLYNFSILLVGAIMSWQLLKSI